jgi:TM2 domain-containing membrane protein YozV
MFSHRFCIGPGPGCAGALVSRVDPGFIIPGLAYLYLESVFLRICKINTCWYIMIVLVDL